MLPLVLLACQDDDADTSKPRDTADDSGATDTGDSAGPGDTSDSAAEATLGFVPTGAFTEPLVVMPVDAYWESLGATAACSFAAGAYAGACEPLAGDLADSALWPGTTLGNFVAFAFTDGDGSGSYDAGEHLVAMPSYQLVYVDGEPSEAAVTVGLATGWNAVDLYRYSWFGEWSTVEASAIPLSRNLEPCLEVTLAGTVDYAAGETDRLAVLFSGDAGSVEIDAGLVADPWAVTLSGEADPGWLQEVMPGFARTEGWVAAYADTNGNGARNGREEYVASPHDAEGNGIDVVWHTLPDDDPATLLRIALSFGVLQAGWSPWNMNTGRPPEAVDDLLLQAL